jgi:hypothetical protein
VEAGLVQVLAQERLGNGLERSDLGDDEVGVPCSVLVVVVVTMGVGVLLASTHGVRVSVEHICPSFLHAENDRALPSGICQLAAEIIASIGELLVGLDCKVRDEQLQALLAWCIANYFVQRSLLE